MSQWLFMATKGENETETEWIDAWVRWNRKQEKDVDDYYDDEEDQEPAEVASSFGAIVVLGHRSDSQAAWSSTGLTIWRSADVICQTIEASFPAEQQRQRILELGSGLGLVGLYVASKCESTVFLTDGDTDVLQQLRRNVNANAACVQSGCNLSTHQLIWGTDSSRAFLQQHDGKRFDWILGSDLIYVSNNVGPLFQTVTTLLAEHGVFWMAYCARRTMDEEKAVSLEDILSEGERHGLASTCLVHEDEDDIWLHEFRWVA